ncbi:MULTISPECIES: CsbD family protein [unclassified Achromobacter]|uniref:CsbD family protein n=1 Tax=unclassified Achromobacter TaxID=2626865 RepID=UPI000B51B157|nr:MULTISPECIES: CsbD family protein [unclassified Achromobacter]OWT77133.1 hypothetical protein CEY04_14180 [Achromobacter sp. HZ28]OWT78014.1 hypothetical protein CEY05_08675 [Achromobacter sp. HZ34]
MLESVEGKAQKMAGRVQDAVGGLTGDAATQVEGKVRQAAGYAQESYGEALGTLRDKTAENPIWAVAIAAAAGYLLGTLSSRR